MKPTNPDDLVDYLYNETDESTRQQIEERLEQCEDTRTKLEEWRATMSMLDQWELVDKVAPKPSFGQRLTPLLKIAAVIALLIGSGVWIGQQWQESETPAVVAIEPEPVPAQPQIAFNPQEIEADIIQASAAMTHRQVQEHLQKALEKLSANEARNATLAVFLPPEEQRSLQERSMALQSVATKVARESERREAFTQQIIARARERAARKH